MGIVAQGENEQASRRRTHEERYAIAKRSYSDDDKAKALALLPTFPSLAACARALEIPYNTLYQWAHGLRGSSDMRDMSKTQKSELAERLESIAHDALDLLPEALTQAGARDIAIAMGISLDHARALQGLSKDDVELIQELQASLLAANIPFVVFIRAAIEQLSNAYRVQQQSIAQAKLIAPAPAHEAKPSDD